MTRKLFTCLAAGIVIACAAPAQVNVQWVGRYSSAGSNIDRAKSMVVDASGNSFVVGSGWNGSNFDIVSTKFDANGQLLWTSSYDGPGNSYDEARAIVVDASGNVYVTGYSAGLSANYDVVTIKYDASGVQQWASRYNGTANGFDEGYDLVTDASGNVYVTGGTTTTTSNANYITLKYNSAGVQQWATTYSNNNSNTECAYAITIDATGNVFVTGTSYGPAANDNDIATIKYNNAGAQQWVKRFNGPGSVFDAGNDIVVDAASNVYVTGYVRDLVGTTNYSYATLKYNTGGTLQWSSIYDGTGGDYDAANAICLTPAGNVAVTGHSIGTAATAEDCATLLYDGATGSTIWVRRFDGGASQYDEGTAIASDSSNRIFVTGYSYTPGSNNNYLTIKYEANGDTSWIVKYNGTGNNSDQAYSVALGPTSEVYVGGMSKGAGTNEDYTVVKYCQLTATAIGDTAICLGAGTPLNAQCSYGSIDSVWWTPTAGLSQTNIANPIATPTLTTNYVLHLRNQYGCVDVDSVTVTVYPLPGPQIQNSAPSFCIGGSSVLTAIDTSNNTFSYLWNTSDTTQSITVDSAGTYSVTITNTNGCSGASSSSVTVNPLPVVFAGNDAGFCQSSTVGLCATGAASYAWSPAFGLSDTTIACPTAGPTSSTTYIVYGTDANGCMNSDTVSVYLFPPLSVPVISRNVAVLTSTPAFAYQWFFNSNPITGATSQSYTPAQNGNYYVTVTDTNGCTKSSGTYSMLDVGMQELSAANPVNIYPNPGNGNFTAQFDQHGMKASVKIFTTSGQLLLQQELPANGISTTGFSVKASAGLYFLQLTLEDGSRFTKPLLIQE